MKKKNKYIIPLSTTALLDYLITLIFLGLSIYMTISKAEPIYIILFFLITAYSIFDTILSIIAFSIKIDDVKISIKGEILLLKKKPEYQFPDEVIISNIREYKIIKDRLNSHSENTGSTRDKTYLEILDKANKSHRISILGLSKKQINYILDLIKEATNIEITQ